MNVNKFVWRLITRQSMRVSVIVDARKLIGLTNLRRLHFSIRENMHY